VAFPRRVVLAHLGNGSSLALCGRGGASIRPWLHAHAGCDERRSGDIDPGLVAYLARTEGMSPTVHEMVNTKSGLLESPRPLRRA